MLLADRLDFVAVVEGVPELADQEEIFAFDEAVFDCSGYSFTCFLLVAVICVALDVISCQRENKRTASSIEQSVANLDSVVNGVGTSSVVNFPQAKANLWHRVSIVQLDSWLSHGGCGVNVLCTVFVERNLYKER